MNLELQLIVVACFWTDWLGCLFIKIYIFLNVDLCKHDIPSVEQHVLLKKLLKTHLEMCQG